MATVVLRSDLTGSPVIDGPHANPAEWRIINGVNKYMTADIFVYTLCRLFALWHLDRFAGNKLLYSAATVIFDSDPLVRVPDMGVASNRQEEAIASSWNLPNKKLPG